MYKKKDLIWHNTVLIRIPKNLDVKVNDNTFVSLKIDKNVQVCDITINNTPIRGIMFDKLHGRPVMLAKDLVESYYEIQFNNK